MRRYLMGSLGTIALIASTVSLHAQAPTDDPGVELAFMPRTMTVTLLNEGGKYVAIDLKHIPQGGACRMDKEATIARVGPGATAGNYKSAVCGRPGELGWLPVPYRIRPSQLRLRGSPHCIRQDEGSGFQEGRRDQEGSGREVGRGHWEEELKG